MKSVPLKVLKSDLSHLAEEASEGSEILVTKHNRPYIRLSPGGLQNLYRGSRVGREDLRPIARGATRGRWLKVLEEDRRED